MGVSEYEKLLYECQRQRTELEASVRQLKDQIEKLEKENEGLRALLEEAQKAGKVSGHRLDRFGPMGKPLVW
jgi:predicted RNase H-like nuclease (RuvC/YqgF family)